MNNVLIESRILNALMKANYEQTDTAPAKLWILFSCFINDFHDVTTYVYI